MHGFEQESIHAVGGERDRRLTSGDKASPAALSAAALMMAFAQSAPRGSRFTVTRTAADGTKTSWQVGRVRMFGMGLRMGVAAAWAAARAGRRYSADDLRI